MTGARCGAFRERFPLRGGKDYVSGIERCSTRSRRASKGADLSAGPHGNRRRAATTRIMSMTPRRQRRLIRRSIPKLHLHSGDRPSTGRAGPQADDCFAVLDRRRIGATTAAPGLLRVRASSPLECCARRQPLLIGSNVRDEQRFTSISHPAFYSRSGSASEDTLL